MTEKELGETIKGLKRFHTAGCIVLPLLFVAVRVAVGMEPAKDPHELDVLKSIAMMVLLCAIPGGWWVYHHKVESGTPGNDAGARRKTFCEACAQRMGVWGAGCLVCVAVFAASGDVSFFYLAGICYLLFLFLGRPRVRDLDQQKD